MKKYLITTLISFMLMISTNAFALPLEPGFFFADFTNWESFSDPGSQLERWNSINNDGTEDNWGIISVNWYGTSNSFNKRTWASGDGGYVLTGLFYGIDIVSYDPSSGILDSIGGKIDIYKNSALGFDTDNFSVSDYDSNAKTFTGITEGELWLSVEFVPGVKTDANYNYTVTATGLSGTTSTLTGGAEAYYKIVGGTAADSFKKDLFALTQNDDTVLYADFYSKNSFFPNTSNNDFPFESQDPIIGGVVPEPGTLLLLGAGFLGLAAFGRRRMS